MVSGEETNALMNENNELISIFVSSINTASTKK